MEKRTPHTRLSQVKKLVNAGQVRTTRSALLNADELGKVRISRSFLPKLTR